MNKQLRSAILVALGALAAGTASAKEGGDQYPNGIETWFAGAVPPPGNYFINYLGHYGGDLYNGEGKRVAGTSASAWFNAFRFVKVSNIKVLGGDWAGHVILPVVHQRLNLARGSASASGLGDLTIDPFIVAWHKGDWHWTVGWTSTCRPGATSRAIRARASAPTTGASSRSSPSPGCRKVAGRSRPS